MSFLEKIPHIAACFPVTWVRNPRSPVFPAGHPEENVYVPWVLHIAHKHLSPGHPVGRAPSSPRQSPDEIVYVYVPFPFLSICLVRIQMPLLTCSHGKPREVRQPRDSVTTLSVNHPFEHTANSSISSQTLRARLPAKGTPEAEFPAAAETAGRTAGENQSAGGSARGTARRMPGECRAGRCSFLWAAEKQQSPGSVFKSNHKNHGCHQIVMTQARQDRTDRARMRIIVWLFWLTWFSGEFLRRRTKDMPAQHHTCTEKKDKTQTTPDQNYPLSALREKWNRFAIRAAMIEAQWCFRGFPSRGCKSSGRKGPFLGSQHPSPNVKNLWNFEAQIWLEIITSCDAKVFVLKAPRRHVQK